MPGIDSDFIKHKLNVILEAHPIKQWGRRSVPRHIDSDRRGCEAERGECNNISSLPQLTIQQSGGKEKDWQVESVC